MQISNQTHDYDSRLEQPYQHFVEIDNQYLIEPQPFEQVINEIIQYITNRTVFDTINLIVNNQSGNYDERNKINVQDLLVRTWRFVKLYDKSGIECFLEQLSDISQQGSCSQGRVTRIYQFYEFHMSHPGDDIFKKCMR